MPQCPSCGGNIARRMQACPYCGSDNAAYEPPKTSIDALLGGADAAMRAGNHTAAIELYRQVIEMVPETFDAYFGLAHSLAQIHRYNEAVEAMEAALNLAPGHAVTLFNLGTLLKSAGRSNLARPYFQQALDALNRYPDLYNGEYMRPTLERELGGG